MEIFGNLKQRAGNYVLAKKLKQFSRFKQAHNFKTAQTAGILFTPTDPASFEQIKHFLAYLNEFKLQIYVLGYINDKAIPESFLFWKGINLFSRKELTWNYVPKLPLVEDFIDKPFDILFDLGLERSFPVEYIARLSKSKFKIGQFTNEHPAYDLMFDMAGDKKLEVYLDNIKNYLALIN